VSTTNRWPSVASTKPDASRTTMEKICRREMKLGGDRPEMPEPPRQVVGSGQEGFRLAHCVAWP
jgi:hypothetical protein